MPRIKLSIRVRLTLWYGLLLTGVLLVFSAGVYWLLARSLADQVDRGLIAAAAQTSNEIEYEGGQLHLQTNEDPSTPPSLRDRGVLLRLLDSAGEAPNPPMAFVASAALSAPLPTTPVFSTLTRPDDDEQFRMYTLPLIEDGQLRGYVQVAQSLEPIRQTMERVLVIIWITTPAMILVASFGGFFLAGRALAPIDQITRTVQRISAEDLSQRLNVPAPYDEIGRLGRTFDGMLARLDHAFQQQRQFAANASHELRTPLASIKGTIDVTLARPRSPMDYQRVLTSVNEDVDRLTRVVHDLLFLTRTEADGGQRHHEPLDLSILVQVAVDCVRPLAEAKHQTVTITMPATCPGHGDPETLLRVFINILDNAVAYTPRNGAIEIVVARTSTEIVVSTHDTGPGIDPIHLPHIFERFYRADAARSRQSGGSGLGLAIADQIVRAHGGVITVASQPGHGSVFQVHLPLQTSATLPHDG